MDLEQITYVLTNMVSLFLSALQLLMFIRAILSWLPIDDDHAFVIFVYNITEIVIFPVRTILERSETVASMPIDLSFFVTFILLSILQTALVL